MSECISMLENTIHIQFIEVALAETYDLAWEGVVSYKGSADYEVVKRGVKLFLLDYGKALKEELVKARSHARFLSLVFLFPLRDSCP